MKSTPKHNNMLPEETQAPKEVKKGKKFVKKAPAPVDSALFYAGSPEQDGE